MSASQQQEVFIEHDAKSWEVIDQGVQRKVMAYDDNVMLVKVAFEAGAVGAVHQHYHTQITHIESGVFEVEVEGKKKVLKAGDAFYIPSNALHGVVCIESGVLIDTFSPMREDFIQR